MGVDEVKAEILARLIKGDDRLRCSERNRLIKKALAQEFGWDNVRVKGDRGTAYGWVDIQVRIEKPHNGECEWWRCDRCREGHDRAYRRVWEILRETGLERYLWKYTDEMGEERYECVVSVVFR